MNGIQQYWIFIYSQILEEVDQYQIWNNNERQKIIMNYLSHNSVELMSNFNIYSYISLEFTYNKGLTFLSFITIIFFPRVWISIKEV